MFFNNDKKYVLLDIEGNSASNESERKITQFSALVFYHGEIQEVNLMNRNVNYINSFVSRLTHINVKKCKVVGLSENHMVREIHDLLSSADTIYAYGCDYDKSMIRLMFKKYHLDEVLTPWHDVIEDVKKYLAPSKLKLSVASSEYGFKSNEFHNALEDCYATLFLMNVIEKIGEIMA